MSTYWVRERLPISINLTFTSANNIYNSELSQSLIKQIYIFGKWTYSERTTSQVNLNTSKTYLAYPSPAPPPPQKKNLTLSWVPASSGDQYQQGKKDFKHLKPRTINILCGPFSLETLQSPIAIFILYHFASQVKLNHLGDVQWPFYNFGYICSEEPKAKKLVISLKKFQWAKPKLLKSF